MGRHTPGPWTVVEYGDGDNLAIHDGDSENRICFMATHGGSQKQWEAIQANAELIAAVPDLLEAAQKIYAHLIARIDAAPSTAKPVFDGIVELHDAIAKATPTDDTKGETANG